MKEINFKGLDWHVLEENEGKPKLLLKEVLDEERIKKYVDDEKYRNDCYVRHDFNTYPPFNWEDSYIKNVVLENFKKDLDIECEVTLLTKEEAENLPEEIRKCNTYYWTKSNASDEPDNFAYAWSVTSDGLVNYDGVTSAYAVRPVLILKSETFQEINARAKSCGDIPLPDELTTGKDDTLAETVNQIIKFLKNKE